MTLRAGDFGLPEPSPEDHASWGPHLRTGETLLWVGRPPQGPVLIDGVQVFVLPVAVLVLMAGVLGLLRAATGSVDQVTQAPEGLLAIVVAGSWASWGHLWRDSVLRRRTRYALTTEHAIIATGDEPVRRSLTEKLTVEAQMTRDPGNLRFGPGSWSPVADVLHPLSRSLWALMPFGTAHAAMRSGFFGIARPRAVRDLARAVGATA
ncbi:MAG: hypothetical protein AAFR79_12950 [Pseudomonadota bacterium]